MKPKKKQGFAIMDPELHKKLSRKGGETQDPYSNKGNFMNRPRSDASNAGKKGGTISAKKRWGKPDA